MWRGGGERKRDRDSKTEREGEGGRERSTQIIWVCLKLQCHKIQREKE